MRRLIICTVFSLLSISVHAQSRVNISKLDSLVSALDTNDRFMGSVEFAKNGVVLYSREAGYSSIDSSSRSRTAPNTEYRIGSASKMFTASMIFQLIEANKLKLSTTLSTFFPEIPNAARITIGQMLSHHSGIYDFTRDSTYPAWLDQSRTEQQMISVIASGKPAFAPGARGDYSNSNFVLLGYIIEKLTGHPYSEELDRRIVNPLGLNHTYYGGMIGSHPNEAHSYARAGREWVAAPETNMSIPGGAGAIVSSTDDLTKFLNGVFQLRVVSKPSLDQMMTIQDGYGMGLFQMPFNGRTSFGHSGRIDGFTTSTAYFPADSTSLVVLSNGNRSLNSVLVGLLSIFTGTPYQIPSYSYYPVSEETLRSYQGTYDLAAAGVTFTVSVDEGTLLAEANGQRPFPLEPVSSDRFRFEDANIEILFHRREDKSISGFAITQHGHTEEFSRE